MQGGSADEAAYPHDLEVGCAVVDLNQNNRKGRIVDKSKAWFKVQFPGDASVKSLQKKSLRAIPESQAAAPRTPAPPPAAAPAPDYEFDEAAAKWRRNSQNETPDEDQDEVAVDLNAD